MRTPSRQSLTVCVYAILAGVTLVTYWPVRNYDFVNYDDPEYVSRNRQVQSGLTLENIRWAFTTTDLRNWHPLTWLSLMLDCQLFGCRPGPFHIVNVAFHMANTLLLFLVFARMTGRMWPSAFVAAAFALHPLHVESVAWIAERKDVLSTLCWLLTMWAYVHYAGHPNLIRYLLVVLFFVLGLMAKPMLVTLPFVLLVLDYWPLGRIKLRKLEPNGDSKQPAAATVLYRKSTALGLLMEKIPLFVLSAVSSIITVLAQHKGGTMFSLKVIPLHIRMANAFVSYAKYIEKMFWPASLAVHYPHPGSQLPVLQVAIAVLVLVGLSIAVIRYGKRRPYLVAGWLWFIGTLVPVIGWVQVGAQAMADRYSYIPLIGLFVIVAWAVPELLPRWRYRHIALALAGCFILAVLTAATRLQLKHWKNSITLFEHAIKVTDNNERAHNLLAVALANEGKHEAAVTHYRQALQISPYYVKARYNLGLSLRSLGKLDEAIAQWAEVLRIDHSHADAHINLGAALEQQGKFKEAIGHYQQALHLKPGDVTAKENLTRVIENLKKTEKLQHYCEQADVLVGQNRIDEAIEYYNQALELNPGFILAHGRLGLALAKKGQIDEAIKHFRIVLTARPDDVEMHCNVGILLQQQGKIEQAIKQFRTALQINPDYTKARKYLNAALEKRKNR